MKVIEGCRADITGGCWP